MQMRVEALPLKCIHSHSRHGESAAQRTQRESCPTCCAAPETVAHFLLECPAYAAARTVMMQVLRQRHPEVIAAMDGLAPGESWRRLLADDVLAAPMQRVGSQQVGHQQHTMSPVDAVADYVMAAWHLRSTALAGRETNGGDPMV